MGVWLKGRFEEGERRRDRNSQYLCQRSLPCPQRWRLLGWVAPWLFGWSCLGNGFRGFDFGDRGLDDCSREGIVVMEWRRERR